MVTFDSLYSQFLSSISSFTLTELRDDEIQAELFNLAQRAIASFKFPRVSLEYELNQSTQIHYFTDEVGQKEFNVLLAYMKVYWIEFQLNHEQRFQNQYYDSTVRTFSAANLLAQLNRLYENFVLQAKRAEYNYGRVDREGRANLGNVNG